MMARMTGPRAAWLTLLGLLGAGWVTAHVLSYWIISPGAAERHRMLAETGHGYFRTRDLLILCLGLLLAGFVVCVAAGGGKSIGAPSPWTLALLPPVGFVIQEHLERFASEGAFPTHLVSEPRFLLGLLLQAPFAALALALARLLEVAARDLAQRLGGSPRPLPLLAGILWAPAFYTCGPKASALALRHGERAPPLATQP
jgi:hypothetical protein